jgi:hypothetical protein
MRFEKSASIVSYPAEGRWAFRAGSGQALRAAVWILGVAGFLGPLVLARNSAHADLLRAIALGWFIAFGVVNAVLVLRSYGRGGRG